MKPILIILIFLLIGCESKRAANKTEWLKERGYLKDSSSVIFVKGKDSLISDTTYLQSVLRDSIHTDSIIYIKEVKTIVREKLISRVDTIQHNNTSIIKEKCPECNPSWWQRNGFLIGLAVGLTLSIIILRFKK